MMASEKRLIDANELLAKHTCDVYGAYDDSCMVQAVFVPYIKGAPTVDAVEVVLGKWEDVQETDMYVPDMHFTITKTAETCSQCKVRTGFVGPKPYLLDKICPNCGARMDGGADDGI